MPCWSHRGSALSRDGPGRAFVGRLPEGPRVGESASGEPDCLLQKSFLLKSLISLGPLQASSGSSDYQLLVLPGSLGLAGYQLWVPPACAALGDIWPRMRRPCPLTSLLGVRDSVLLSPAGLGELLVGVPGGCRPGGGVEAPCPLPQHLARASLPLGCCCALSYPNEPVIEEEMLL